jgi:hypothetical protein
MWEMKVKVIKQFRTNVFNRILVVATDQIGEVIEEKPREKLVRFYEGLEVWVPRERFEEYFEVVK